MPDARQLPADHLDVRLTELTADTDLNTRPPGAARAIRTVKCRRLLVVVSGGAAAVILAVATATTNGLGLFDGGRAADPAATPVMSAAPTTDRADEPRPARLSPADLTSATHGWIGEWRTTDRSAVGADLSCLGGDWTADTTIDHFRATTTGSADLWRVTLNSPVTAGRRMNQVSGLIADACPKSGGTYYGEYGVNRYVWAFGFGGGADHVTAFVGQRDERFSVLVVSGAPDPSDAVTQVVADALMADLAAD